MFDPVTFVIDSCRDKVLKPSKLLKEIVRLEVSAGHEVQHDRLFARLQAHILQLLNAGDLDVVYRLRASGTFRKAVGHFSWTEDIMSLRKVFKVGKRRVDGSDARNILVGFVKKQVRSST